MARQIQVRRKTKSGKVITYFRTVQGVARSASVTSAARQLRSQKAGHQGRTSQSAEVVAAKGLRWGGQTFHDTKTFDAWLKTKGSSFKAFEAVHPDAAKGLKQREKSGGAKRRIGSVRGRFLSVH